MVVQDGRLRGISVQLQHAGNGSQRVGDTFTDVAFDTSGVMSAAQAQRAYLAASSGATPSLLC